MDTATFLETLLIMFDSDWFALLFLVGIVPPVVIAIVKTMEIFKPVEEWVDQREFQKRLREGRRIIQTRREHAARAPFLAEAWKRNAEYTGGYNYADWRARKEDETNYLTELS